MKLLDLWYLWTVWRLAKCGVQCALDAVHDLYGFETNAIVTMAEVIEHLYNREYKGQIIINDELKTAIACLLCTVRSKISKREL